MLRALQSGRQGRKGAKAPPTFTPASPFRSCLMLGHDPPVRWLRQQLLPSPTIQKETPRRPEPGPTHTLTVLCPKEAGHVCCFEEGPGSDGAGFLGARAPLEGGGGTLDLRKLLGNRRCSLFRRRKNRNPGRSALRRPARAGGGGGGPSRGGGAVILC